MPSRPPAILRWRAVVTALGLLLLVAALIQFRSASAPAPALPVTYLDPAPLPDGRIVYARSLAATDGDGPTALYTARPDGGEERRITFGDARDRAPAVLPDGRIVFRRHLPDGDAGRLFAINPDGTGFQLFRDPAGSEGGPLAAPQTASTAKPVSLTSVVDERKSTGTLLCLDVRTSRLPVLSAAKPGAIRTVRVFGADGQMLGEAAVEADGSFFVEVPADQPLHLELRGPDGVLAADHSGFWVRPNENRGCIGCHEDPELAPENRVVLALARGPTRIETAASVMPPEAREP